MAFGRPDEFLTCVEQIDAKDLAARGFTTALIDIDNTLVPRDTHEIPASVVAWIESLKAEGLRICLITNNWHKEVLKYAEYLELPIVHASWKPVPIAFLRAIKKAGGSRRSALVIGDQVFTDVFGADFLRMYSILVLPQASKDLTHTLMLRRLERFFLRGMTPTR